MVKILLLEDDMSLAVGLRFALEKEGWAVDTARTLAEGSALWAAGGYTLLVLDVSLPDGTGFDFCRRVRASSDVPIIFLTASDEETSIIMGLDIGGDDYITKPFKLGVLMSRVNALLRRAGAFSAAETELASNGIRVLLLQGQAYKNGEPLELTAVEYKLLCLFMRNANTVLTKGQILDKLWDCEGNYIDSSTLTVYIRRLRMEDRRHGPYQWRNAYDSGPAEKRPVQRGRPDAWEAYADIFRRDLCPPDGGRGLRPCDGADDGRRNKRGCPGHSGRRGREFQLPGYARGAHIRNLHGLCVLRLCVSGDNRAGNSAEHCQQHFHERMGKDEAIRRDASRWHGWAAGDENDSRGGRDIRRAWVRRWLRHRSAAEQADIQRAH